VRRTRLTVVAAGAHVAFYSRLLAPGELALRWIGELTAGRSEHLKAAGFGKRGGPWPGTGGCMLPRCDHTHGECAQGGGLRAASHRQRTVHYGPSRGSTTRRNPLAQPDHDSSSGWDEPR